MDASMQRLQDAVLGATSAMSAEDLSRHPDGRWSAAEILEHLYLSYVGTMRVLERVLGQGRPLARRPSLQDRIRITLVVELGYFPTGRKSPEVALPKGTPPEKVIRDIASQIVAMDEMLGQCESKFGPGVRLMDHPILGPLSAAQWRKLHWLHGQHHLKQISRLRAVK